MKGFDLLIAICCANIYSFIYSEYYCKSLFLCTLVCWQNTTIRSLLPGFYAYMHVKGISLFHVWNARGDSPANVPLTPLRCPEARKTKRVMKVPKGTSDYQATWIVDDGDGENGEADEESSEEDDDDDDMLDEAMEGEDEDNMSQVNI